MGASFDRFFGLFHITSIKTIPITTHFSSQLSTTDFAQISQKKYAKNYSFKISGSESELAARSYSEAAMGSYCELHFGLTILKRTVGFKKVTVKRSSYFKPNFRLAKHSPFTGTAAPAQPTHRPTKRSTSRPINQLVHQPVNRLTKSRHQNSQNHKLYRILRQ